jgi:nitrogen fixation NifU-like protein
LIQLKKFKNYYCNKMTENQKKSFYDHYEHPDNVGSLDDPTHKAKDMNSLCGDISIVNLRIEDNKIKDIKFDGTICGIAKASGSVMTDLVMGRSLDEVKDLYKEFEAALDKQTEANRPEFEDMLESCGYQHNKTLYYCTKICWKSLMKSIDENIK